MVYCIAQVHYMWQTRALAQPPNALDLFLAYLNWKLSVIKYIQAYFFNFIYLTPLSPT